MKKTKITIAGTVIEVPFGQEVIIEIGKQTYNFDTQKETVSVKTWETDDDSLSFDFIQYERK